MDVQGLSHNVVVVAHLFNPSVMSQLWLVKHRLVEEEEFEHGCVFTDELVHVRTKNFGIYLVPLQLQFNPLADRTNEQALIVEKLGSIINILPHTPYTAAGLNFVWHFTQEEAAIKTTTRKLFFKDESPIYGRFDTEDAHFGGYLSKNSLGCRLRLDIKPILVQDSKENRIQFAFNYHLDVQSLENPVAAIADLLLRWDEARAESENILRTAGLGD